MARKPRKSAIYSRWYEYYRAGLMRHGVERETPKRVGKRELDRIRKAWATLRKETQRRYGYTPTQKGFGRVGKDIIDIQTGEVVGHTGKRTGTPLSYNGFVDMIINNFLTSLRGFESLLQETASGFREGRYSRAQKTRESAIAAAEDLHAFIERLAVTDKRTLAEVLDHSPDLAEQLNEYFEQYGSDYEKAVTVWINRVEELLQQAALEVTARE